MLTYFPQLSLQSLRMENSSCTGLYVKQTQHKDDMSIYWWWTDGGAKGQHRRHGAFSVLLYDTRTSSYSIRWPHSNTSHISRRETPIIFNPDSSSPSVVQRWNPVLKPNVLRPARWRKPCGSSSLFKAVSSVSNQCVEISRPAQNNLHLVLTR